MSTIDIKKGDLIQHHKKGLARFDEWDDHNVMVFKPLAGGKKLPIPEHQFIAMIGRREIIRIEQDADGNPIETREFGPDECWTDSGDPAKAKLTPAGRRALAFQFCTKRWDEEGNGSLGDDGLQKIIDDCRKTMRPLGIRNGRAQKNNQGRRREAALPRPGRTSPGDPARGHSKP
jgi:putative transposase